MHQKNKASVDGAAGSAGRVEPADEFGLPPRPDQRMTGK